MCPSPDPGPGPHAGGAQACSSLVTKVLGYIIRASLWLSGQASAVASLTPLRGPLPGVHVTDEQTEAQRDQFACPGSHPLCCLCLSPEPKLRPPKLPATQPVPFSKVLCRGWRPQTRSIGVSCCVQARPRCNGDGGEEDGATAPTSSQHPGRFVTCWGSVSVPSGGPLGRPPRSPSKCL